MQNSFFPLAPGTIQYVSPTRLLDTRIISSKSTIPGSMMFPLPTTTYPYLPTASFVSTPIAYTAGTPLSSMTFPPPIPIPLIGSVIPPTSSSLTNPNNLGPTEIQIPQNPPPGIIISNSPRSYFNSDITSEQKPKTDNQNMRKSIKRETMIL